MLIPPFHRPSKEAKCKHAKREPRKNQKEKERGIHHIVRMEHENYYDDQANTDTTDARVISEDNVHNRK